MPILLPESTTIRLCERFDLVQATFDRNQTLIAALEDTIDYFDTSDVQPSSYLRLCYIKEAYRESLFSLGQHQRDLGLELKALQIALILSPRPGRSQLNDSLETCIEYLRAYQDTRAEISYQEAQYIQDLDVARDCLRAHASSGATLPASSVTSSPAGDHLFRDPIDNP
jgi:hypothetical protein